MVDNRKEEIFALVIFVIVGVVLRLVTSKYHPIMVPDYDGYQYIKIARGILNGTMVSEAINWSPFFPALIAIVSPLPLPHDQIGSYINIVLGSLTVIPIYYFTKRMFSSNAGELAVAIYVFNPVVAYNNVLVMSETSFIFSIFLIAMLASKVFVDKLKLTDFIAIGLAGAVSYHSRPEGIIVFFLILAVLFFVMRDTVFEKTKRTLTSLVFFFAVSSPYIFFMSSMRKRFTLFGKDSEGLNYIKRAMGIPDEVQGFFGTFFYDIDKTAALVGKNLGRAFGFTFNYCFFSLAVIFIIYHAVKIRQFSFGKVALFIAVLSPLVLNLLFVMDFRYFALTASLLSAPAGIGLAIFLTIVTAHIAVKNFRIASFVTLIAVIAFTGVASIEYFLKRENLVQELDFLVRQVKTPGIWLKVNSDKDSVLYGSAYTVGYYADREFNTIGRGMTIDDIIEKMAVHRKAYFITEPFALRKVPTVAPLMNPRSQVFKSSPLSKKLKPVYTDYETSVFVYELIRR